MTLDICGTDDASDNGGNVILTGFDLAVNQPITTSNALNVLTSSGSSIQQ